MSDQFPSLADVLAQHRWYPQTNGCFCGNPRYMPWADHFDHQAEIWREACTVTTVEQLDALPEDVVILDGCGAAGRKVRGVWWWTGTADPFEPDLPARVIHNPDWETK